MTKLEKKIPLDILTKSLLYPLLNYKEKYDDDLTINEAKGEIEKFKFSSVNKYPVGKEVLRQVCDKGRIEYSTTWTHLGKGYFKQISKVKDIYC